MQRSCVGPLLSDAGRLIQTAVLTRSVQMCAGLKVRLRDAAPVGGVFYLSVNAASLHLRVPVTLAGLPLKGPGHHIQDQDRLGTLQNPTDPLPAPL